MVLNGRIKTGNVAGDLRAIPVTSESAGRRPKSGYLVDSRKGRKMAGVSGWGRGSRRYGATAVRWDPSHAHPNRGTYMTQRYTCTWKAYM